MPDGDNESLPDLDYAFLAEYAKVEAQGTLTVVGASFTRLRVPTLPAAIPLAVAGRLRVATGETPVQLRVVFSGPSDASPRIDVETEIPAEGAEPYDGRLGLLFAIGTNWPIQEYGIFSIEISLDGSLVRTLKFHAAP